MRYFYSITLLILASATLGWAQDNLGLSTPCSDAIQKMAGSQDINACLPISKLLPLVASNTTDITTLTTAADAVCGVPKCADSLVSQTQTDFKASCQTDLNNNSSAANLINVVISLYSPIRDSSCYMNSTNGYCFVESYMAANQIIQAAPKDQSPVLTFAGAPKEVVCTPCNKAITNTFLNYQKDHPDAFTSVKQLSAQDIETAKNALISKCGDKFVDGEIGNTKETPTEFQQNTPSKSDASFLTVNGLNFVVFAGSILALL